MKKLLNISLIIAVIILATSCSDVQRTPGHDYMPDMRYSRAYETYSPHDNLKEHNINYTGLPVAGTVPRTGGLPYRIAKDKDGDSTNYVASSSITNPLPALNADQLVEAERLYLINCGICHGTKLDGNGPLYNDGNGPYPAKPRDLAKEPYILNMPDGRLMYSITYGKGSMGPYGPQLSTTQRWMIIHYMKSKQGRGASGAASASDTTAASGAAAAPTGSTDTATAR